MSEKTITVLGELAASDSLKRELCGMDVMASKMIRCISLYIKSLDEKLAGRLLSCTKESLQVAILDCARIGLYPSSRGNVYLIPYGNKCKVMIGYLGMEELALRNPAIMKVQARLVYAGDEFRVTYGSDDKIIHVPDLTSGEKTIIYAYAFLKFKNNTEMSEIMSIEELEKARQTSKSPDSPAWKNWRGEMYKKVVMKRLKKHIPYDDNLSEALTLDNGQFNEVVETATVNSEEELLKLCDKEE